MTSETYTPDVWMSLIKSIGALSIVLGIIIGVLFLFRRFLLSHGKYFNSDIIKIISLYYISPKDKIVLLDVLGEKILLGVTPQNINFLTKISSDTNVNIPDSNRPKTFFNLLKAKQNNKHENNSQAILDEKSINSVNEETK
ncbi:MAG: flagellar biosynthetic protein FliO [Desulfobacterales bacterium]|nr:flagellar biosynthetic protein FliO [Desulfobacterales bacterium]